MNFDATVLTKIQTRPKGINQPNRTQVLIVVNGDSFTVPDIQLDTFHGTTEFKKWVESLQHGDQVTVTISVKNS